MKRMVFAVAFSMIFCSATAFAELYEWKDSSGVIHITDDLNKVPEEFQGRARVYKTTPSKETPGRTEAPPEAAQPDANLYGDHPLEWWRVEFDKLKAERQRLEKAISDKNRFIDIFEGGRRTGQIFSQENVDAYERYKKEVLDDEYSLQDVKDRYDELKRKATIAGVPRDIRGE